MTPLIKDHEIINIPSAALLLHARNGQRQADEIDRHRKVAIFSDPIFSHEDRRMETVLDSLNIDYQTEAFYNSLPGTVQEAEKIASFLPSEETDVFSGFEANRERLMSADFNSYQVLHFATHGIFNEVSPLRSGFLLSVFDEEGQIKTNLVRAEDMPHINFDSTELVFLSSCRTAVSNESSNEAVSELMKSLITSGVDRIIASLWSIPDESATIELVGEFYKHLFSENLSSSPASSLREAQLSMWSDSQWESPYFWAAFTIYGDWQDISRDSLN